MLRTIVAHIYPPFVFLFWIAFFLILTKVLFYYKRKTMHITAEMHGTRLVVSIIGGLFSIFLGFVTFISWTNYKEATSLVAQEVTQIYTTWENSRGFPSPVFQNIDKLLQAYVFSILNDEWPSMQKGNASPITQDASQAIYSELLKFHPPDSYSQSYYNRVISSLNAATETRNQRINMLNVIIPSAWYLMILIGTFTIIIVSIFLLEGVFIEICIHVMLCIFLSFYLTAIIILSHPLSGLITISNQPYKALMSKMNV
ncbi:TPA: DUF4239 domain-containing protein [Legionella anisa]|uniref:bestrophin-like domain n=1 Tax=Legionella anisa TaxID=28082 RepID=UPI000349031F|nr:DUF4239 domain-containing protein [Legionella anisa]AWN75566.1 DUF4239 domain-containing protein [Legionella anisa]MBN5935969.1 DUF4239 domain-containing protein [Legionella anisa]MCW8424242.1 DUF4239 domain-containing protein [Legionella anisa]MCW8446640.1 DUF4239 domain-containing protein [Legionella anisa]